MYKELPLVWQNKLDKEIEHVYKEGFYLSEERLEGGNNSLVVLLTASKEFNQKLFEFSKQSIPNKIQEKIFLQPYTGYHISIQWSKEFKNKDINSFLQDVKNYVQELKPIITDVYAIYPSDNNLFVIPHVEKGISKLRNNISKIFDKNAIPPKLPPSLDTMWISTVRMKKQFTKEEIDLAVNFLPKKVFKNIVFDTLVVALSNQVFSKDSSEILYKARLNQKTS